MLTEYDIRRAICEIGKRLYAKGYVAAKHGNISYKYSENEYFCTPSGVAKIHLTPDKIVKVDATGKKIDGGSYKPSGSTGSATQGNVSSVEDWNVGMWQNPGAAPQASYEPFNPYATPVATMSPAGHYTTSAAGVKLYDSASAQSASTTLPMGAQVEITGTEGYDLVGHML